MSNTNSRFLPIALFVLLIPVLLVRIAAESTHYCTPDSIYYLEVANNILMGNGPVGPKIFDFNESEHTLIPLYYNTPFGKPDQYEHYFFSVWPLGYPAGIAAVSLVTGLDVLWASKLFNILLLGIDFYLLVLLFGKRAELVLFYFCSFTMLEICSYTWSENLYLSFFILLLLGIKRIHQTTSLHFASLLLISIGLIGMSLSRYASLSYFFFISVIMVMYGKLKAYKKSLNLFFGLLIGSIIVGLYLSVNYIKSGYITGMPRVNTQEFGALDLTEAFFRGLFNQLHIIKQFRYSGKIDFLYYCLLTLSQLAVIGIVYKKIHTIKITTKLDFTLKSMTGLSIGYLLFLIYTTAVSTIDPFDYRTLLPFSFPLVAVLLVWTHSTLENINAHKTLTIIKIFFIISLLLNLPKFYIANFFFN